MQETDIEKAGYYIELVRKDTGALQALWIDMDAPGSTWADVAFPVTHAQRKQVTVKKLHVWSNFGGVSQVAANDDTVDGKRNRYPLILLDSSVIVSVKICKSRILIQRILLYIDTRRVNVCSENVHAVLDRISSDVIESQCLLVVYCIHFVSCTKLSALCDHAIDVSVSGSFSH